MHRLLIILISASLILGGCSGSSKNEQVLVVLKTLDNPFFIDIQDGFEKEWKKSGLQYGLTIKSGQKEGDVDGQRMVLDGQYSANVAERTPPFIKGVVLTPSTSGGDLVTQIKNYREAGIPVILLDTGINKKELQRAQTDYNLLIRSDNKAGGKVAAIVLSDGLKGRDCNILILNGVADHDTAIERREGFIEESKSRGCTVVMEKTANWRRDEAQSIVSQLTANWKFTGVFAANDEMALGALSALQQAGAGQDTLIVGFDATAEARKAVNEGRLFDTIAQDPVKMGKEGARALVSYLGGKKPPIFDELLLPPKPVKH